jgi:hypothetical protein
MSFTDAPAPDYGKNLVSELRKRNPNVVLVFFRNKNKNVVVCEAVKRGNSVALDVYWLDIDPAYRAPRRASGIRHDRSELTQLERDHAFGAKSTDIDANSCSVTFNSVPHYTLRLEMAPAGSKLVLHYEGNNYRLRSVNVIANDGMQVLISSAILKKLQVNLFNEATQRPAMLERNESGHIALKHF